MSSKCCSVAQDNARRILARIRCLKECVDCLKSFPTPLPAALCYVAAEVEYKPTKITRLICYSEPSKESKRVAEIPLTKDHRIFICSEFCSSDGQWGKLTKVTLKGKDVGHLAAGEGEKWILVFSSKFSGMDLFEPISSQKEDSLTISNEEILWGKKPKSISSWEKVVEHQFALKLGASSCKAAPSDEEMVKLLQTPPPKWTMNHDEMLVQFLCQHVEKEDVNLGSIKDYVESINVSTMSDEDGPQNLTDDNPETYWETDGSQGQHWIRLKMKKGTVIKKLLLAIDSSDDNYTPSRILVMGGEATDNLKKLNDVTVELDNYGVNDVLILSDQSEHIPVIDIRIKECKDDGIDTRIHGIKIKSSKERDLGISLDLFQRKNLVRYPLLEGFEQDVLYRRAVILQRLLQLLDSVLLYLVPRWDYSIGSYSSLQSIRQLLPLSKKRMLLVDQFLRESETSCPTSMATLYISRRAAMEHKSNPSADPQYKNSVFTQIYEGLKPREPSQKPLDYRWPTRYEQWWECKFLSEGIIDHGGGFRDSISDLSEELCPSNLDDPLPLPFFIRTPNHDNPDVGSNRDLYITNPQCTEFHKYEWIGKLMGACLRGKENLVLALPPFFWKKLCGQEVSWSKDYAGIDEVEVKLMDSVASMDEESFQVYFSERNWTCLLSSGTVVPLRSNGAEVPVLFDERCEYAKAVQEVRMNESNEQILAIQRGLLQVMPQTALEVLRWQELEKRVCGDPEIPMEALKNFITYEDMEKEDRKVKYFIEVLENFSNEDRSRFLRFVTGRRRLPAQVHVYSADQMDALPSAATCASYFHLPNYSSVKVAEEKIRYAIYNCIAIDTDTNPWEG